MIQLAGASKIQLKRALARWILSTLPLTGTVSTGQLTRNLFVEVKLANTALQAVVFSFPLQRFPVADEYPRLV
ncbi:hypothetical protein AB833_06930 [Chromatiales bacterium (ex Bugula neritina AB1)]|nr:hypothetical protein AB833_06930 [Chromatiales bacterium (ex Bugula neritina AB1)]